MGDRLGFDYVVTLFIKKREDINTTWVIENPGKPSNGIIESLEYFKSSWLDIKVRKWYRGAAEGHVMNNNGLESLNAVLKSEITKHKLLPFSDFLIKLMAWMKFESSLRVQGGAKTANHYSKK